MMENKTLKNCKENQIWSDFLSDYPCGVLRCSYEEYPQVLSANPRMLEFLGLTEESPEWRGFIQRNIFFMLPFEERCAFRGFLEKADATGETVEIGHRIYNTAEGFTRLAGWVRVDVGVDGRKEYHFLYMRFAQERFTAEGQREKIYQKILQGTYDLLFQVDSSDNTITCIYRGKQSKYKGITGVRVIVNDLIRQEFFEQIHKKDRERLVGFFQHILSGFGKNGEQEIDSMTFRTTSGVIGREHQAVAARLDDKTVLLCIRDITGERRAAGYSDEDEHGGIQEQLGSGDGNRPARIISFHIKGERVYPLSSCIAMNYYGELRDDEYDLIRTEGLRLIDWMGLYHIPRNAYEQALQEGEVVLSDDGKNWARRMYLLTENGTGEEELYTVLLLYSSAQEKVRQEEIKPRVTIRTFGYFDVLIDDKPVIFRYEKSKEMLAILVDRKGSFVANPYFISCLWENEPYSEKIQGRCRQTAYRLMETLKQYGIEDIIEKVDGRRRIIPEKVDCDYFHYIRGDQVPGQSFNGAYMLDYSWGETTLSGLMGE